MHLSGARLLTVTIVAGLVSAIEIGEGRAEGAGGGVNHVKFKVITDGRSRALLRGK